LKVSSAKWSRPRPWNDAFQPGHALTFEQASEAGTRYIRIDVLPGDIPKVVQRQVKLVATTDTGGAVKSETVFDAWGNVQAVTGASANKFGYTGHQMDRETGLVYFQARYYDPEIGRFISKDPYEGEWATPGSLHRYLYACGNTTLYVDLHGYESVSAHIDNWAEGCGLWSCAGYALMKGAAAAATLGFTTVHDPVRDQYDQGKITGEQYAWRGIGGGMATVAINATSAVVGGGAGTVVAPSVLRTVARASATAGATAGITDAATQATHISAGLQEDYNYAQTVTSATAGAFVGAAVPVAVAGGKALKDGIAKRTGTPSGLPHSRGDGKVDRVLTEEGGSLGVNSAAAPARAGTTLADNAIFTNRTQWSATRPRGTAQTYDVIQRNDIDWARVRTDGPADFIGKTNAEAAAKGFAPQLADDSFSTLHHIGQDARGPLAEASTRYHGVGKSGQDALHSLYGRNMPHPDFPIDRRAFNVDTREHWKWRLGNQ